MTREELERKVQHRIAYAVHLPKSAQAIVALVVGACCAVARETERQQDNDHGAANTGGAAATEDALRSTFLPPKDPSNG